MKVTIKDIAEYCHVSLGTVDRALNNRSGISEKTKERILKAAEYLEYHPNYVGRSLARGRTMTIGVVCFDLYNNFFPELIDTIERRAKEKGYFIYLILTHRDFLLERDGLNYLYERQVDGIILFPIGVSESYIKYLKGLKIPIVTIYNKLDESFPFVGVNDRAAMEDAVGYLVGKGYQRIVYLTPEMKEQETQGLNTYTLRQRFNGYLDGVHKYQLKRCEVLEEGHLEKKLGQFLSNCDFSEKTAFLCLCDSYAVKTLKYLREQGVQVPEQIGLMGYDNIEQLQYIRPRLATIQYSVQHMGQSAIDILFQCIEDSNCREQYMLSYSLVEGESLC